MKTALAFARSSDTHIELSLNGAVGESGFFGPAEYFTKETVVDAVNNAGPFDVLDVVINSPGGDVFEGLAIYNYLTDLQIREDKTVNTRVAGLAASAGSVILMAGSSIEMPRTSSLMIHDPWTTISGNAKAMRDGANFLDYVKSLIAPAYMARASAELTEAKLYSLMEDETWLDADGAKALGLCSLVTDSRVSVSSVALSSIYNDTRMRPVFMSAIKNLSDAGGGKPLISLRTSLKVMGAVVDVPATAAEPATVESTVVEIPVVEVAVETPAVETVEPTVETPVAEPVVETPAVEAEAVVEAEDEVIEPNAADVAAQAAIDAEAAHVAEAEAAAARLTAEAELAAQAAAHQAVLMLKPADVAELCAAAGCPEITGTMMRAGLNLSGIQARLAVRTEIRGDLTRLRNAFPSGPISNADEVRILACVSVEDATKMMTDILAGTDPARSVQHHPSQPETVKNASSAVAENRKLHAAYSGTIVPGVK